MSIAVLKNRIPADVASIELIEPVRGKRSQLTSEATRYCLKQSFSAQVVTHD